MNLIAELQAARKRLGLKQQELAEQAGLSRMTVQRIESGAIDPRLSTLAEMARVLGLELVAVAAAQPAQPDQAAQPDPAEPPAASPVAAGDQA
ncbi:MAG: helix-turn-helix transcriptional regulator [Curvibacter lanceolatus]|uniref:helix-turn-helix transcriptional regulator n=1 Tax=Curvibacter lanceolatus TaxID=86182 RepID=UPI0023550B0C|nr:helix-turn-helix transcriptional regulator [Curvibacter lanceolatus]MBV5293977.1 helix-turn-helix transcriptional regulator [Curvibacter lanceolatus]